MKKSSFLEGAYIATICIVISKILGILYVIPFYDMIGEQGGALYGYAYNIYNVFLTISAAGIPFAISKLTSEYDTLKENVKKRRMYKISTDIVLIFSIISFIICFFFAPQISNLIIGDIKGGNSLKDVVFVIKLIAFALLIIPLLSIERGYLQGHKFISSPSISQVIEQVVRIAVILIGSYITIYLLKIPIKYAVGVSVFAASLGGIITFIYLKLVVKKNKKELNLDEKKEITKKYDKEIIRKIISYSIPFIIINLANTLYNSTDMILILRTLPKLGYSAANTETISSIFTTWGIKFNSIITSVSTGLIVSLIPNIVSDYTKGDIKSVNRNFNKCLKMVLAIIVPLALFVSLTSDSIWYIFYGKSLFGPKIVKYTILVTIFDCLYMITNSLMQSLNKRKIIYISVILGLIINLILDIPCMYLFKYLGLSAYCGAIFATFIGFLFSIILSIGYLKKNMNLNYNDTIKIIPRSILSMLMIILVTYILRLILPINSTSKLIQILNVIVIGLISGGTYLLMNFKVLKDILPEKILRKLKIVK